MVEWQAWHTRRRRSCAPHFGNDFVQLEKRIVPASTLQSHGDIHGTGANLFETTLSPANVRPGTFGKLFATPTDGQVYAQPLVWNGIPAAYRPRPDVADVVFVATEHDTIYSIASTGISAGTPIWTRNFLDTQILDGRINNPLGATTISTLSSNDVGTMDINPEIGITGTPVLDESTGTLYVVVKTKEDVDGVTHFVQRLHALSTADGSDRVTPYTIGDTFDPGNNPTNRTEIFVYGTSDGNFPDTFNHTDRRVVTFNALRENQRAALRLVNGEVYIAWASHGDNGPFHGWVAKFDVSDLSKGIRLSGVLNTSPNNGQSGIWQSGGGLSFEPDGSAFYFETGNGTGREPKLGADGFPINANYNEALLKVLADSNSTPAKQNANGWGFRIADYFVPYNMTDLDQVDGDSGSGETLVLPESAGIPGHPKLIVATGKEGKIYVLDRDNLGKFNPQRDEVVSVTPLSFLESVSSSPAWYDGALYYVGAFGGKARRLTMSTTGALVVASETPTDSFGNLPGSPSISANGSTGGIAWFTNRATNTLHAFDARSLSTELWNSGQNVSDNLGASVKFAIPSVANGQVFVGTTNSLVVYGLKPPANKVPSAPTNLSASVLSGSAVELTWSDTTSSPNTASGYRIEQSTDGNHFTLATTVPSGISRHSVGGLLPNTTYVFRVVGFNGLGNSSASDAITLKTTVQIATLDFSGGFTNSNALLAFNGISATQGTAARITNGTPNTAGSIFSKQTLNITKFSTTFTFRQTGRADGMTFAIQSNSPNALGGIGSSLGYGKTSRGDAGIPKSVAIKFDLFGLARELPVSTGMYMNGVYPGNAGAYDIRKAGIDFTSGHLMSVRMDYSNTKLSMSITDTVTGKSYIRAFPLNLRAVLGTNQAYVGFTGSTGALGAVQDVLSWTFSPAPVEPPATPTALGAATASATSVALSWSGSPTNQTGYQLDRASDIDFTQNLLTQNLPADLKNFTDTAIGISPGNTYFYRIRAINTSVPSANSNTTSVKIPLSPARASNAKVANVLPRRIDLTWTDHAGLNASGYRILRSVDRGLFSEYTNLPPVNAAGPNEYEWSDTGVQPGHYYEYRIIAFNVSGSNDFVGVRATTPSDGALDFSKGFTGSDSTLQFNGSTRIKENLAQITTGNTFDVGSVFSRQPVDVRKFQTEFTFRQTGRGDGMTFTIQSESPTAVGQPGGSLGYGNNPMGEGGIAKSASIKFDVFDNAGEGSSSTGLFLNGAYPTNPGSISLDKLGINLASGELFKATIVYDGRTLKATITDTVTNVSASQSYTADLAGILGTGKAYVGFTGGSGELTAVQEILSWTYGPLPI